MMSSNRLIIFCICFAIGFHRLTAMALSASPRRALPEKVLVGYATHCSDKVVQSVREGVNVVIWSFVELKVLEDGSPKCVASFDVECARTTIAQLDEEGYDETVHLVSFGGWNGPHLPDSSSPKEMYEAWKELVGDVFHGVDWDLEGHDRLESPTNVFSVHCLEAMGEFSALAKQDGFLVGMAPPQSYLDIYESRFSRFVNLTTNPSRGWHDEFHYYGQNVYAYVLSKFGASIDFVSVQFYESYSRAGYEVFSRKVAPETYLETYVKDLVASQESFFVDFGQDPSIDYSSRIVSFPLSKLVFGFANGWGAKDDDDKVCYFDPKEIGMAYQALVKDNQAPRGFMFWVIGDEGEKNINFSKSLGDILGTRNPKVTNVLPGAKEA